MTSHLHRPATRTHTSFIFFECCPRRHAVYGVQPYPCIRLRMSVSVLVITRAKASVYSSYLFMWTDADDVSPYDIM